MASTGGAARDLPEIPGYEVVERAGRSAFGACYIARQVSMDRTVTVKVVPEALEADVRRLRREIQLLVRLAREELVGSIDEGAAGGLRYFVHERPEGETLETLARGKGLAWREAVSLGADLARLLDDLHGEGIALREIHPANLIRTPDGRWRLTSLELAVPFGGESEALRTVGPPRFVAPELLRKGAKPTVQSDLFSLGAVAYFAAAGRPPFGGATVQAFLEEAVRPAGPEPLSDMRGAPRDLDRVLARLLAPRREDRYASARQARVDLERVGRGRRLVRRRARPAAWLVASAVAMALLGLAVWLAVRQGGPSAREGPKTAHEPAAPRGKGPGPSRPAEKTPAPRPKHTPSYRAWIELRARLKAEPDDIWDDFYNLEAFLRAYPSGPEADAARTLRARAKEACDKETVRDVEAVKAELRPALLARRYAQIEARMQVLAKRYRGFEGGTLAREYLRKVDALCRNDAEKAGKKARALAAARRFDEALDIVRPLQKRAVGEGKAGLREAIAQIEAARDRWKADRKAFAEARAAAVAALRARRFAEAAAALRGVKGKIAAGDLAGQLEALRERAEEAARGWKALLDGIRGAEGRRRLHYRDALGLEVELDGEIRSLEGEVLLVKRHARTDVVRVPLLTIAAADLAALAGAPDPGPARRDLGWALCFGGAAERAGALLLEGGLAAGARREAQALIEEFLILQDRSALDAGRKAAEEALSAGDAAGAEAALAALIARFARSPAYPDVREEVEARFADVWCDRRRDQALAEIVHGKVEAGGDGRTRITYAFDRPEEALDWSRTILRKVDNGWLSLVGRTELLPGAPGAPGMFRGTVRVHGVAQPTDRERPNVNVIVWARSPGYELLFGLGSARDATQLKMPRLGGGFVSLPANLILGIERAGGSPKETVIAARDAPKLAAGKLYRFAIEVEGARASFRVGREYLFRGDIAATFPVAAKETPEGTIALDTGGETGVNFGEIVVEGAVNHAWVKARLRARAAEELRRLREKAPPRGP